MSLYHDHNSPLIKAKLLYKDGSVWTLSLEELKSEIAIEKHPANAITGDDRKYLTNLAIVEMQKLQGDIYELSINPYVTATNYNERVKRNQIRIDNIQNLIDRLNTGTSS